MNNQLKNLNLKIWNKASQKWEKSNIDVRKGIYLIHFQAKSDIYEVRNLKKKPFKKHVIEKDEIVLKSGKFTGGLKNRIFGSSGYANYWKHENEIQGEKREISDCFGNSSTIYLIADLSDCEENIVIELVEVYTKLILNRFEGVEKQEKRTSEYYKHSNRFANISKDISSLRNSVETFIDEIIANKT